MEELPREFYRLDELAQKMKGSTVSEVLSAAAAIEMTISRFFKGYIVGAIGNIFDSSSYGKVAVDKLKESVFLDDALPFHVGYVHLRKDEVVAAALRRDQSEKVATAWIINDSGDVVLLPGDDFYTNNDLFVLSGEVDRVEAEYPDLFKAATQQQEPKKQITGEATMVHMGLSSRKTQDGDQETLVGDCLIGMEDIKEFFHPVTWLTIKRWLSDYGVLPPGKGDIWRVKVSDATAIRSKKRSFIDKRKK